MQKCEIKTTLRHDCSPVNLLHIFRISFPKNTSGRLLPTLMDSKVSPVSLHFFNYEKLRVLNELNIN